MARAPEAGVLRHARAVGVVVTQRLVLITTLLLISRVVSAQLPEAEDAFARGDYRTARALYDSALALDSLNPRALYRLAVFDSWDGKLKQSLARFVKLRRLDPSADVMVAHARVLAWDGQTRWSEALFDSALALTPDRSDALAGRARAVAWSGDLDRAERLWRNALERHPDDPEILVGLAQTLFWEGEPGLAEGYVARARALAPTDRTARDLFDLVRAERRPTIGFSSDGSDDIEHNRFVTLAGTLGASLSAELRGTLRASWRRNTLGGLVGTSDGLDGWLVRSFRGGTSVRAGFGARSLTADSGTRTFATVQAGVGLRPGKFTSIGIGYNRYPFDETAVLVRKAFVWDELDVSTDIAPNPSLDVSVVGNAAWLSDGNRRLIGSFAVMVGVASGLHVGAYTRIMGYRSNPRNGYFAPDRFTVGEGRAAYAWRRQRWALRLAGGLGAQQVGASGPTQVEWHGDVTVSRSWRAINELALVALYTNSAAARSGIETTPTYRYWSVGLRWRTGL